MIKITKGFDIPLSGKPELVINQGNQVTEVGLTSDYFNSRKPQFAVRVGDQVKKGQVLFVEKQFPEIKFVSPVSGTVKTINRGDKRIFQSVVIELAQDPEQDQVLFTKHELDNLTPEVAKEQLLNSGLWTAIRQRPFENIANPNISPSAFFVNATDTNPVAADPSAIILADSETQAAFEYGLGVLNKAFSCPKYLVGNDKLRINEIYDFQQETIVGLHPAGLVGTHLNLLHPVSINKPAFHIGYQDVIAIGKLFKSGKLDSSIVVAIAGPKCTQPALYKTLRGANLSQLVAPIVAGGPVRVISGSVLNGTTATGPFDYLTGYVNQVTLIEENEDQRFLGWALPQPSKVSISKLSYFGSKDVKLNTSTNGSHRALIPLGFYERVFPLDIYITLLLRDLLADDSESAQQLGVTELAEEDLALCTFVCTGKNDFGQLLRDMLNTIEKEG